MSIREAFGQSVVLSLDFDSSGRKGPVPLFDDPGLWPLRIVAMSLARVGAETGPDIDRLKSIVELADGRAVYAAGGVRNADDLARIASVKAQGAIVASALHAQAVTHKEIAALLRERRP
jgi:phosphoribosylformimino-5-aminoimidazole carboxamide ribotide isomerase